MEEKRQTYKKLFEEIQKWAKVDSGRKTVICCGDLTDVGNRVSNKILKDAKRFFMELEELGVETHLILGNHDFQGSRGNYVPVLLTQKTHHPFVTQLHISPVVKNMRSGTKALFIPYYKEEDELKEVMKKLTTDGEEIIFMHNDLPGAVYPNGRHVKGDDWLFEDFEPDAKRPMVFSGHIHKHQVLRNGEVVYIGSPYQINFGEEGEEKGVILLNSKTKSWMRVSISAPEFKTVPIGYLVASRMGNPKIRKETEQLVFGNHVRLTGEIDYESWKSMDKQQGMKEILAMGAISCVFQLSIKRERRRSMTMDTSKVTDVEIIREFVDKSETEMDKATLTKIGEEIWESTVCK